MIEWLKRLLGLRETRVRRVEIRVESELDPKEVCDEIVEALSRLSDGHAG